MNKFSTGIVGAAFAVMAMASVVLPAHAGGGVRLNFGGPLGVFKAHSGGDHYGSSHYARKSNHSRKNEIASRKAAARRAQIAEAKEREAKRRRAAQLKAEERARTLASAKREERKAEIVKAEVVEVETAEAQKVAPVKASAIAGADTLVPVVAINNDAQGDDVHLKTIDVETRAQDRKIIEAQVAQVPPPKQKVEEALTCKKFVPSAGLTINVPCGD